MRDKTDDLEARDELAEETETREGKRPWVKPVIRATSGFERQALACAVPQLSVPPCLGPSAS